MKKHPLILCAGITSLLLSACNPVKAPEAILPVPEAKQVEWQKMETYAFVHFGLNTLTTVNGDMETPILKHSTLRNSTVSNG